MAQEHPMAVAMKAVLARAQARNTGGVGSPELMAELQRLSEAVASLTQLHVYPDPTIPADGNVLRVGKAAIKFRDNLAAARARVEKLIIGTRAGFEAAFNQNAGFVDAGRAAEIRAF